MKDAQWISVEDSLPQYDTTVLLVMQKFGTRYPHIYIGSLEYNGDWYTSNAVDDRKHDPGFNNEYITHWMPLPEPPQSKS